MMIRRMMVRIGLGRSRMRYRSIAAPRMIEHTGSTTALRITQSRRGASTAVYPCPMTLRSISKE